MAALKHKPQVTWLKYVLCKKMAILREIEDICSKYNSGRPRIQAALDYKPRKNLPQKY